MRRATYCARLLAWVAALGLAVAGAGCAATADTGSSHPGVSASPTATAALTATPSPLPITAFTCAAGSLPVRPEGSQVTCSVSPEHGDSVLRATYSISGGSAPSVDENALRIAGWQIATEAHGDGAVTSRGFGVFLNARAYFAFQWIGRSDGSFTLTVQTSVPPGNTPIPCGQIPTGGSTLLHGVALPTNSALLLDGSLALAPACAADVQRFYASALPAAGWHEDQPFSAASPDPSPDPSATQLMQAVFSQGTARATITIAGNPGTQTLIVVGLAS